MYVWKAIISFLLKRQHVNDCFNAQTYVRADLIFYLLSESE